MRLRFIIVQQSLNKGAQTTKNANFDVTVKNTITYDYKFTLAFKANGDVVGTPTKIGAGADITLPEELPKAPEGKVFAGWAAPAVMPAKDLVVNARFADAAGATAFLRGYMYLRIVLAQFIQYIAQLITFF